MLQSLQQAASTFAGMVTAFCHKMGWLNLELLIGQFQESQLVLMQIIIVFEEVARNEILDKICDLSHNLTTLAL